jgi:hypothetical protein
MLTKIKRDINHNPVLEIELDNIAYLSRQSSGSSESSNSTPQTFLFNQLLIPSSLATSPGKRFNYASSSTKPSSTVPILSPVALGKRKEVVDDDASEAGAKPSSSLTLTKRKIEVDDDSSQPVTKRSHTANDDPN